MEISTFRGRNDLDALRHNNAVDASPATASELPAMADLARRAVPGLTIADAAVERVFRHDPECIFPFRSAGRILGGIAFLHLNEDGLVRLLLDEISFSDPRVELLARPGERPAAIYVWALAARGRASAGIGNVSVRLRREPYARADYYAQPSSSDGKRLLGRLGFERTASFQPDLWLYRRRVSTVLADPALTLRKVA
ncbi:MAG: hypothetical protein QOJ96_3015 [Alphaproteobacteria bacterium]|nr:hypothetical protein [Alphaproteobacteria bacterium]